MGADCCCDCCGQLPSAFSGTWTTSCGTWTFAFEEVDCATTAFAASPCQRCWRSDIQTVTCNPVGTGGTVPICDTPVDLQMELACCTFPGGQTGIYVEKAAGSSECDMFDFGTDCLEENDPGCPEVRYCPEITEQRTITITTRPSMPCPQCQPANCECMYLEITW